MPAVFILGLDGLEYNFVEKWNLCNLKQRKYGKLKVPINEETGVPSSPEVWASFLTGKYIHKDFKRTVPLDMIFKLLVFMRRHVNLSLGLGKKIIEKTPRKLTVRSFPTLEQKTFLDLTNSTEINVPYYNYDDVIFNIFNQFQTGNLSLKQTINVLKFLYEKRKKQIFSEIEKLQNVNLIFAFMHFPDALQHFLFTRPTKIKAFYLDLDNYISTLKNRRIRDSVFIIVSDHGFNTKTGNHSKYGFYSLNIQTDWKPKSITDFYSKILEWFGKEACATKSNILL